MANSIFGLAFPALDPAVNLPDDVPPAPFVSFYRVPGNHIRGRLHIDRLWAGCL